MIIYLLRHGETTGDLEQRFGGDYEDSLTPHGKDQVRKRAKTLLSFGIKKIVSSPRIRAQESAALVGRALGLPTTVIKDWRERNFYGVLTGMTKKEGEAKYPELVKLTGSYKNRLPNGEAYEPFKKRILDVFKRTCDMRTDPILVVAHGGPLTCIARELLGKEVKIHDCGLMKLHVDSSGVRLETLDKIDLKQ